MQNCEYAILNRSVHFEKLSYETVRCVVGVLAPPAAAAGVLRAAAAGRRPLQLRVDPPLAQKTRLRGLILSRAYGDSVAECRISRNKRLISKAYYMSKKELLIFFGHTVELFE